jgi:hypothetical protein
MQGLSAACLHVCNVGGVYWVGFYYCDASQNGRKASISCNSTGVAKTQLGCGLCSCFVVDRYIQTKNTTAHCMVFHWILLALARKPSPSSLVFFLFSFRLFTSIFFYTSRFTSDSYHTAAFFYAQYNDQYVYHEG